MWLRTGSKSDIYFGTKSEEKAVLNTLKYIEERLLLSSLLFHSLFRVTTLVLGSRRQMSSQIKYFEHFNCVQ